MRLIGLAFVFALLGCGQPSPTLTYASTYEEGLKRALAQNKLAMVKFYATWCAPCKDLDNALADPFVVREAAAVVPIKVDGDSEIGKQLGRKYGVDSYPTVVFVDGKEREVYRFAGALPPPMLIAEMRLALGRFGATRRETGKPKP